MNIKKVLKKYIMMIIGLIWFIGGIIGIADGVYITSVTGDTASLGYSVGAGVVGLIGYFVYREGRKISLKTVSKDNKYSENEAEKESNTGLEKNRYCSSCGVILEKDEKEFCDSCRFDKEITDNKSF